MKPVDRCAFGFGKLVLILWALGCLCPYAMGQAQVQGQWKTLSYMMPINPIHASLMHNGQVLVVAGSGNNPPITNYQAAVWDPKAGTITTQSVDYDMFCNGMVVLPDGRPFVLGGTLQYDPFYGSPKTSAYDPNTGNFVDLHSMAHGRWYPTGTTLSDGRIMVFSGLNETSGATNTAVEIYTVGAGWSPQYPAPWTPTLYPRMHLLPDGKVFISGYQPNSYIFDPSTQTWTNSATTNYDSIRTYGSSVLLPLTPANNYDPRVMIFGGGMQGGTATNTTEMIDLSVSSPQWQYSAPMSQARIEMDAVLLPTGKVLALGGSSTDEDSTTASLNADLFDPVAGTMSSAGANAYPRLYHSNALLLPDATVALFGGNPQRGSYEPHIEIYSPAYLFTTNGSPATRPTISSVNPGVIGYGSSFQVATPDATNIASVVLVRAGSVTHASDMDQRLVGLSFTQGSGALTVTGPPNGNIAPPGYYLLFILNNAGVPSVATFVHVSLAPADQPPTGTITGPASDLTIQAGKSVSFSGTGSDPDGTISAYSWVFPGGSPAASSVQNPGSVTFSTPSPLDVNGKPIPYLASLTVTDNAGLNDPSPPIRKITVVPSFTLSATPTSTTVAAGGTGTYTVTLTQGSGFSGTVSFSVTGLPSGATGLFNPSSLTTSGSSTLSISTIASTPPASYTLTITGTSGEASNTATVTLVVGANFTVSVSPKSQTIARGKSGIYTVTLTASPGLTSFSVSGLPPKTTASFNPTSVTSSGSSTLTVHVGPKARTGTSTLTIKATTSEGLVQSTTATLTIQ